MLKIFFLTIIISSMTQIVFATPLEQLVPSHAARLRSGQSVLETQLKSPTPRLLPQNNELRRLVTSAMGELKPSILAETLFLYRKPESARTTAGNWNEAQKTGIYNQLLAFSSLAGIQYFSATRGVMRTFYETSHVIDGPNTKKPLADPFYATPPAELSLFARQKDLTFGDNIYKYSFYTTQSYIMFMQENITSMTYGVIPVIGRNNLKTFLVIFDCGDSLLIYGASMTKAVSVPGMGERVGNSFGNRAQAVLSWFTGRADMVYN